MTSPSPNGINFELIVGILKRRLWIALTLFSLVLAVTLALIRFLPSVYTASAFILVEGQQIPQEYVQSTVTADIEKRLHTISQQILSRSRLQRLIQEFGLYENLRKRLPLDEIIAAMRRDIGIEIKGVASSKQRHDRGTVAFAVSYTAGDPGKVMAVVNTLASFYIEENLRMRERQALGTSDFLRNELDELKKRLEEQEQRSTHYKRQHLGELPGQMDANLKTLERLQGQMQLVSDHLARAQDRRATLSRLIEEVEREEAAALNGAGSPSSLAKRIHEMNRELTLLRSQFSDKYPDVSRLERAIAVLEEQLQNQSQNGTEKANGASPPGSFGSYGARLEAELSEVDSTIKLGTLELENTRHAIAEYQKRIENTPKREQELLLITRNYETTRQLYASLLKRQEEANLASSMEQRQKAERFEIIDPATRPQLPVSPNRPRLFLVGLFLSFVAAGGGVFLRETADRSFHGPEQLQAATKFPVLVAIPRIVTSQDRWRSRRRWLCGIIAVGMLLCAVVWAVYFVAAKNEELVKRFSPPNRGLQFRR